MGCHGVSVQFAVSIRVKFAVQFSIDVAIDVAIGIRVDVTVNLTVGISINFAIRVSVEFAIHFAVDLTFEFAVGNVTSVMVNDLTVIFLTLNHLNSRWEQFHREHLLRAVDGRPMIVISKEPMDLCCGAKYLYQSEPPSAWNVYVQLLRGALLADTKYVAVAEDDTLYPRRHFSDFRPPDDAVAYDMSRWSVFSWAEQPYFSAIRKHGNFTMIGPRQLVISALEEREAKYPNGKDWSGEIGRSDVERRLGVRRNVLVEWYCIEPMVNLCHPQGLSPTHVDTPGQKRKPGELKAWDIPVWGKASDIAAIYNQGVKDDAQLATTP